MRILAALMFVAVASVQSFSCTCGGPLRAKTMREYAEWYVKQPYASLIFDGKVIKQELRNGSAGLPESAMSMTGTGRFRVVDFAVTRVFRGDRQDHISVSTGLGGGDCGYDFQTGQSYLVIASKAPGGAWFTSICSGTNAIEDSGAALRLLRGDKPTSDDLLSPQEYWKQYAEKILPKRTGSICGVVSKPDGNPLKGASVELWQLRDDDLPSRSASDPNTSTSTGRFCIENATPGRYLLTVEDEDYDHDARYMAFYPGVNLRKEAIGIDIKPGVRLPDVTVTTFHEKLYTIHIRVTAPDGARLSYENGSGVSVDSIYGDPLSYHISHTLEEDGSYTFGYIPAGKYVITTFFEPNFDGKEWKLSPGASMWKPSRQEVTVVGDTEVVIHVEHSQPN